MALERLIEEKGLNFSITYYGLHDLGTGWNIESLINNYEFWEQSLEDCKLNDLSNIDDYYDYFLMLKISEMEETLSILKYEEHKPLIKHLVDICNRKVELISTGMLIDFINRNIECIFSYDGKARHDIRRITIKKVLQYVTGIKESVLEYLCGHYGYLVLDNYSGFEKRIESNPNLFDYIFPTANDEIVNLYRFDLMLEIWTHILLTHKSNLKDRVRSLTDSVYQELVETVTLIDKGNVIHYQKRYGLFLEFLRKTQNPKANYFIDSYKQVDAIFNEYMRENAQCFKFEIPVGEIVSKWKATEDWVVKIVSLTHDFNREEEGPIAISRLETVKSKESLFDIISNTNIPIDSHFTVGYQQALDVVSSIAESTFMGILCDEKCVSEYLGLLFNASMYVAERVFIDKENFVENLNHLLNSIRLLFANKNSDETVLNTLTYGVSMYACAFCENFIKQYYVSVRKDELYIDCRRVTLGELLKDADQCMVSIFGVNHIRNLAFFYLQNERGVGHNIRNSLAHWSNLKVNQMNLMFASKVIWLLTDVVNTLLIDCVHNQSEENN